jgi:hypothetical protein
MEVSRPEAERSLFKTDAYIVSSMATASSAGGQLPQLATDLAVSLYSAPNSQQS